MRNKTVGFVFFLIVLAFSLLALLKLYEPFLMNLLVAFLIALATMPIYEKIEQKLKFSLLSAFCMTLLLVGLCFLPFGYLLAFIAHFTQTITPQSLDLQTLSGFLTTVKEESLFTLYHLIDYLPTEVQTQIKNWLSSILPTDVSEILKKGVGILTQIGKQGLNFLNDTAFIIIFIFCFYYYGQRVGKYFLHLIPIEEKHIKDLYNEVAGVLSVVFYSSIASMALQGFLFGILMYYYDYNPLLCGILYGFASLVPIVGGTLVWLPIAGYELYLGDLSGAIIISLYSIIVIATLADNGVKPFLITLINRILLKSPVEINEMLVFFAIIAGISSFGFFGIVLGPAITAFFVALLRIYKKLYNSL